MVISRGQSGFSGKRAPSRCSYTSRFTLKQVAVRDIRLFGDDTYFLTGTDEHGQKIAESSAKEGIEPQVFVDRVSLSHVLA